MYLVKKIGRESSKELLELSRTCHTGSDAFFVDRSPDFFALPVYLGDKHQYFGVYRNQELVACAGVSRQKRVIEGKVQFTYYLHDLRANPAYPTAIPYVKLIRAIIEEYQSQTYWLFCTILDTNANISSLTKGSKTFPVAKLLGTMKHVGVPMFISVRAKTSNVRAISKKIAWEFYSQCALQIEFAPMDELQFYQGKGDYLGFFEEDKLVSVCKITDQTLQRKLIAVQTNPLFKVINLWCKLKRVPLLPSKNEKFIHGYLSYYVSNARDYRKQFLAYVQKNYCYSYVFFGLKHGEVFPCRLWFSIMISSTTYGYGQVPQTAVNYPEISLI